MARYELHALCSQCHGFHDLGVRAELDEVFEVRTITDVDPNLPEKLFAPTQVWCQATRSHSDTKDPSLIILVAEGRWRK